MGKNTGRRFAVGVLMVLAAAIAAPAQTYSVLYTFTGGSDGSSPQDGLVPDAAGNLYGTTSSGGNSVTCPGGCGVVFKLDSAGSERVLYAFAGAPDGRYPVAGLISDKAGNLYGTTRYGGNNGSSCNGYVNNGCGVVFKLDASGRESLLYTFTGGSDGSQPYGGLVRDTAGNLYGTTWTGGYSSEQCGAGCGVVFKLDPVGNETVLHSFTDGADGALPFAGLVRDSTGNLYGTAAVGGNLTGGCSPYGCGVVFKVDTSGTFTVLHGFIGTDGYYPSGGLARDAAGNLYGTTAYGGSSFGGSCGGGDGCGVVFKLDPAGNETVLHSFLGASDGELPYFASLIQDVSGNLYGTTEEGGAFGYGTIFEVSLTGKEVILHSFAGTADDSYPTGTLLPYKNYLYGTAAGGNEAGGGVVFRISLH